MYLQATGTFTDFDKVGPYFEEEMRVTAQLKSEGSLRVSTEGLVTVQVCLPSWRPMTSRTPTNRWDACHCQRAAGVAFRRNRADDLRSDTAPIPDARGHDQPCLNTPHSKCESKTKPLPQSRIGRRLKMSLDVDTIRKDFPILDVEVHGRRLVYILR